MNIALRIVVVAPDLAIEDPSDDHAITQAERSRSLRIGLLENGFNLIASLPADVFLTERIAQLQPDLIIVDAESDARDALEHVVMATREARRPIIMFAPTSWPAYPANGFARFWTWHWPALNTNKPSDKNWPTPKQSSANSAPR